MVDYLKSGDLYLDYYKGKYYITLNLIDEEGYSEGSLDYAFDNISDTLKMLIVLRKNY